MRKDPKPEPKPGDKDYYVHLTYPYNRPGPLDRKDPLKDLSKTKEFNYAYPSVTDFQDIKWKLIDCCAVSNEGNTGVIFVHSKDGNFVLKGSSDPAVEYFGNLLFQQLRIPTPRIELITHDDPRFKLAISNLDRATYFDQIIKHRVRSRLDRPFLLLMEYIPGLRIHDLGIQRTKECFETSYPEGRDRLIMMGIILITDVFINNMDRYPLIWKNNGNSDNLVVKFDTDFNSRSEDLFDKNNLDLKMIGLIAVDNKPNLFGKDTKFAEDNYIKYLDQVEELVQSIFYSLALVRDGKLNPFDNSSKRFEYASIVSTFIYNHTNIDIRSLGELQILLGMCLGLANIATVGYDVIENLKNKVLKTVKNDWKGFWAENCQSIRLELIADMIKIFQKYVDKCIEIIGWANTITLNQYLIKSEKNQGMDGDGDSSVLSVHDENEEEEAPPEPKKSEIESKYEDMLDKKIYEFFGVDFKEQQSKPTSQLNLIDNIEPRSSSQKSLNGSMAGGLNQGANYKQQKQPLKGGQQALQQKQQQLLEQQRLEQERLEKERLEQERLEQERLEQERLEQERLEQERLLKQQQELLLQQQLEAQKAQEKNSKDKGKDTKGKKKK